MSLTDIKIRTAKPKEKIYEIFDGGGMCVRITPRNTKTFILNYRSPATSKRTGITLGKYPELSLADARIERQKAIALIKGGTDPRRHREEIKAGNQKAATDTFSSVVNDWYDTKLKRQKSLSKRHKNDLIRSIEIHLFPDFADTPIGGINAPDVIASLKALEKAGKLDTLRRVVQRTNEVMTFAVNSGRIHHNPLNGIGAMFEVSSTVNNPHIDLECLPDFIRDVNESNMSLITKCAIKLQLLCLYRPGEVAALEWNDVDFDNQTITIDAKRMKMNRDHVVPISTASLDILKLLKQISGNSMWVFPSVRDVNKHIGRQTANEAMKRIGYKGKMTAHGMRALASTALHEVGYDSRIIELQLSHKDKNAIRATYNKAIHLEERRKMLNWWGDLVVR